MQFPAQITNLLLAAGFMVVGAPASQSGPAPSLRTTVHTAQVQFTNSLSGSATLSVGDKVLFSDVAPGVTSKWATVSDSLVVITVKEAGEGKKTASATQKIEDGAKYTVVVTPGMNGQPQLAIRKASPESHPDTTQGS